MEKIYIQFGESVLLNSKESMYIYADVWTNRMKSLMEELLPQVYNSTLKAYEASLMDYDYLIRRCNEMHVEYERIEVQDVEEAVEIPQEFKYKTKPYKHQEEAINFGLSIDRFLLCDEMGLGKTKTVIDLGVINKIQHGYKHCLIICCVNGLKWNWEDEVHIHSDEKCHILGNRKNSRGNWVVKGINARLEDIIAIKEGKFDDTYFLITNIETLRDKKVAKELKELCDKNIIQMIAVDEIHKCASNRSQQSKGLLKLRSDKMIAMTGSPIMNNPLDLYVPLNWLGYDRHNFTEFKNHFCRFGGNFNNIVGFKNMEQIQSILSSIMLRRLKADVLDLPEKIYSVEYVEMSNEQAKIYNEVLNDLREQVDLIARSKNPLANLIRLRQATGHTSTISSTVSCSAKYERCLELVKEYTDLGHKVIIFSNWTSMTDILQVGLSSYNPAVITGATKNRQEEKDRFMNDPNCKVIIGTTDCMGVGYTLTAADIVIFFDLPWTWATYSQACDRAHRIGTKSNVQIVNLITKNTIDERILDIVMKKKAISEALIDNLSCEQITELLNILLS